MTELASITAPGGNVGDTFNGVVVKRVIADGVYDFVRGSPLTLDANADPRVSLIDGVLNFTPWSELDAQQSFGMPVTDHANATVETFAVPGTVNKAITVNDIKTWSAQNSAFGGHVPQEITLAFSFQRDAAPVGGVHTSIEFRTLLGVAGASVELDIDKASGVVTPANHADIKVENADATLNGDWYEVLLEVRFVPGTAVDVLAQIGQETVAGTLTYGGTVIKAQAEALRVLSGRLTGLAQGAWRNMAEPSFPNGMGHMLLAFRSPGTRDDLVTNWSTSLDTGNTFWTTAYSGNGFNAAGTGGFRTSLVWAGNTFGFGFNDAGNPTAFNCLAIGPDFPGLYDVGYQYTYFS